MALTGNYDRDYGVIELRLGNLETESELSDKAANQLRDDLYRVRDQINDSTREQFQAVDDRIDLVNQDSAVTKTKLAIWAAIGMYVIDALVKKLGIM